MNLFFTSRAWEDYLYWPATDSKLLARVNALIKQSARTPFTGTGKPEPLRGSYSGFRSRRITQEHRLVYRPTPDALQIIQCRYHY